MRSTPPVSTRSASAGRWRGPGSKRAISALLAFALALISLPFSATTASAAPTNVARTATVTASSQNSSTGQTAAKAIDGSPVGYPGDATKEWATVGGRSGSWIKLTWASPVTINKVVLYDRPNTDDRVTGGQLTWSIGGTAVNVPSLANAGTATTVNFTTRTVTSLTFTVSSVSSTTHNVGLAEIEVWTADTTPVNAAPVANAGADVSVVEGTTVTLNGSGTDANGDALTYAWGGASAGLLSATNVAKPTFAATTPGTYTFSLVVNDGKVSSAADTVVVTVTANRAPVANAGADQTVARGATVTLNGSGTDADNQPLTYAWSGASAGLLSATNVAKPTFTASTVAGTTYTFTLTVNDGLVNSATDSVVVTVAANTPPVANAGADQTVTVNAVVTLNGSGTDGNGDPLTYKWTAPAGVNLSSTTAAKPTFTASTVGSYTFSLVVNDGTSDSAADTVVVTVNQAAPVSQNLARTATATASSQNTSSGQTAAKAIDGSPVGYPGDATKEWATVGGKAGSWIKLTWAAPVTIDKVVLYDRPNTDDRVTGGQLSYSIGGNSVNVPSLANAGTATTVNFTPRTVTSITFTVSSVASTTHNVGLAEFEVWGSSVPVNVAPVANAGPDQSVVVGSTATLAGSGTDGNGDALTYAWTPPAGVTLSATNVANPTFAASTIGTYTFSLVVNDGKVSSAADSVTVSVNANRAPVANAGADQSVAPNSIVTLNGSGTDPDNQALTYEWTPPAGVTLSALNVAKPTFTAGATPGTTYAFTLKVSDGELSHTDDVSITVAPLGMLTVATSGSSGVFTATFEPSYSGKTVRLQYLQFATKTGEVLKNAVTTAIWKQLAQATVNSSGQATFTITNPYEVEHSYRAIVDQGGATEKLTNEVAYAAPRSTRNTGLATIYIDTNESEAITSKDDYWEGAFTLTAPTGSRCTAVNQTKMKVAGRGNSTWELPKKPYKFGLYSSTDLCGLGKFKKWNLIANYEDTSYMRNSLTYNVLGASLTGLEWTPKSVPVDVYINGSFQGSYTLTDRVTGDLGKRVNIDSLKSTSTDITGGYLMEWDNRRTSHHNVNVGSSARVAYVGAEDPNYVGRGWVGIKEPEDEADGTGITPAQLDYIDGYLEQADDAIAAGNWEAYIDGNSAADFLIAMELTKTYGANMRSSVFMYKKKGGKIFFGPLWDFDTAYGNANYGGPTEETTDGWWVSQPDASITSIQGSPTWFHDMMDDPDFQALVKTRWAVMKATGLKANADAWINTERAFIASSVTQDTAKWGAKSESLTTAANNLRSWFDERYEWLDGEWG